MRTSRLSSFSSSCALASSRMKGDSASYSLRVGRGEGAGCELGWQWALRQQVQASEGSSAWDTARGNPQDECLGQSSACADPSCQEPGRPARPNPTAPAPASLVAQGVDVGLQRVLGVVRLVLDARLRKHVMRGERESESGTSGWFTSNWLVSMRRLCPCWTQHCVWPWPRSLPHPTCRASSTSISYSLAICGQLGQSGQKWGWG